MSILLANASGTVVGAVHAGWRGIVAGVIENALSHFQSVSDLLVAVGPCIGPRAFEVKQDVCELFLQLFPDNPPVVQNAERIYVDLRAAVIRKLQQAGLALAQIDVTDLCTYSCPEEFYSVRRDGHATGRMAALIGPR